MCSAGVSGKSGAIVETIRPMGPIRDDRAEVCVAEMRECVGRHEDERLSALTNAKANCAHIIRVVVTSSNSTFASCQIRRPDRGERGIISNQFSAEVVAMAGHAFADCNNEVMSPLQGGRVGWY